MEVRGFGDCGLVTAGQFCSSVHCFIFRFSPGIGEKGFGRGQRDLDGSHAGKVEGAAKVRARQSAGAGVPLHSGTLQISSTSRQEC